MKKLTIQDRQIVEVGAMLVHRAADQTGEETKPIDHACELIDIDANQLHGLVRYTAAPFEGEEQWVPGDLLAVAPEPAVPPVEPEPTPVLDAMKEAGLEAAQQEAAKEVPANELPVNPS